MGETLYTIFGGKLVRFTSLEHSFSLTTIDPDTGATTNQTALTFLPPDALCDNTGTKLVCDGKASHSATALATHPETGQLWAVLKIDVANTRVRRLAVIDPVTAVGVLVGPEFALDDQLAENIAGLAFVGVSDTDNDGVPDDIDNCPTEPNPYESCASGTDCLGSTNSCVGSVCREQHDNDDDGLGDECDDDDDADGILDVVDNCPIHANSVPGGR